MKKTPLLKAVLQIFSEAEKPLAVSEIKEILAKNNFFPNKTTLYRMLNKLCESGQIEDILLDPKTSYYELKKKHHHHFRCQKCNTIQCIPDLNFESQVHSLEKKLQTQGLKIKNHHFSFDGLCATCH